MRYLLFAFALFFCAACDEEPQKPTHIVATTPPVAALLRSVVDPEVEVTCLMPAGSSPHGFQLRPAQKAACRGALLVSTARDLEPWAPLLGARVHVVLLDLLPESQHLSIDGQHEEESELLNQGPIRIRGTHDHDDHCQGVVDPHFWLDPLACAAVLPALTKHIPSEWRKQSEVRLAEALSSLQDLDARLRKELKPLVGKKIVQHHPSFGYFCKAYGIDAIASISTGSHTVSTEEIQAIYRTKDIDLILSEVQLPADVAERVAQDLKVPVCRVDPLGRPDQSIEDIIHSNARAVMDALFVKVQND